MPVQHVASPIQTIGQSAVSGTGQVRSSGQRETFTLEELAVVLSHFDIGVIDSVVEFPRGSRKDVRDAVRAARAAARQWAARSANNPGQILNRAAEALESLGDDLSEEPAELEA